MIVNTEKIELDDIGADKSGLILDVLEKNYSFDINGAGVKIFKENTAASNVYLIELSDNKKIVVKRSFWHTEDWSNNALNSIEEAYGLSERLRVKGAKLPKVYRNDDKGFVTKHDNEMIVVLEFKTGKHFEANDNEFVACGHELAVFHKAGLELLKEENGLYERIEASIPFEKAYEESRKLYHGGLRDKLLGDHDCAAREVCQAFRENINAIDSTIDFLDGSGISSGSLAHGILHNDLHSNNVLFDDDGAFSAMIDIDQVGVGPLVWDIGNSITSFISNYLKNGDKTLVENKLKLFLQSYHDTNPLPKAEYGLILAATQRWDVLRILRSLRRHRYENNRLPGLLPKIKTRLIPRVQAMPEIYSFLTLEWLDENIK